MILPSPKSEGEETLALHLRTTHYYVEREYRFHPKRKWRADFFIATGRAAPKHGRILVEIDGGNRMVVKGRAVGRHMADKDYEKHNEAVILGHRVLRFTPAQVKSGYALDAIRRALS